MKKTDNREGFLKEYKSRLKGLEESLEYISSIIQLRLSQLAAKTGSRAWIPDSRIKKPRKLWTNARKLKLSINDTFTKVEDVLGVRIVCNNLSDIKLVVNMLQSDCSFLEIVEVKDMTSSPTQSGYRATHVRTVFQPFQSSFKYEIPCEIQIRTLSQDSWARLSRADLYDKNVPPLIKNLSVALSTQLSAIDEIAQQIRNELNKPTKSAKHIKNSDNITPQRLTLLYKKIYKDDIYEWTLIDWVRALEEAELKTIGEVKKNLQNDNLRNKINSTALGIRGYPIENEEWVVLSAIAMSEVNENEGVKVAKKRLRNEWDEIEAYAKSESLRELPETFDEFVKNIEAGDVPWEALSELGGRKRCGRCHKGIFDAYSADLPPEN